MRPIPPVGDLHHLIAGKIHIGVSVELINVNFAGLIDGLQIWMGQLITFIVVECQFLDYDPVYVPGF